MYYSSVMKGVGARERQTRVSERERERQRVNWVRKYDKREKEESEGQETQGRIRLLD